MKREMKNTTALLTLFVLLFCNVVHAQSKWKEFDTFLKVMSPMQHAVEAGDLKLLRSNSVELVKAANALKSSTPPASCKKNADLPVLLDKILYCANQIEKEVKANASSEILLDMLVAEAGVLETLKEFCL